MKLSRVVSAVLIVGSMCVLQSGCQPLLSKSAEEKSKITPLAKAAEPTGEDANGPAPVITFEKTVHNFGQIAPGSSNVCEFEFKNTGNALLKITRVKKTCGCTPFTLAKKEYAPGESGTLKVKFNASTRKGSVSKSIYVHSNDRKHPKVKLAIKANIVLKIAFKPEKVKLLLNEANAACPKITINSLDGKEFAIKKFISTNRNCITADFDPNVKATKFEIEPRVDTNRLKRKLAGHIKIDLTHPDCRSISIPYKALAQFNASPQSIIVRNAEPKKTVVREIWLQNNYKKDFTIESISSKKGYVKVLSRAKLKNQYQFQVEVTPPELTARGLYFRDVLTVNIEGGQKVDIGIMGYYAKHAGKAQ